MGALESGDAALGSIRNMLWVTEVFGRLVVLSDVVESDTDRSPTFKRDLGTSSPVIQLFCLEWRKDMYLMLFFFLACDESTFGSEVSMPKPMDPCDRSTASSSSTAGVVGGVESRECELD